MSKVSTGITATLYRLFKTVRDAEGKNGYQSQLLVSLKTLIRHQVLSIINGMII